MTTAATLAVRCFAREDEGLVEEWPVTLTPGQVRALVRDADTDPTLSEIHPIDLATAEKLVGKALEPYSEEVDFFLEPMAIAKE
jgi:hypothetical protein